MSHGYTETIEPVAVVVETVGYGDTVAAEDRSARRAFLFFPLGSRRKLSRKIEK